LKVCREQTDRLFGRIPEYNDLEGVTFSDVERWFEKAIALREEEV
jgi:hypothetical protein